MTDGDSQSCKDGIVLFGYEQIDNIEEIFEENNKQHISAYDFVFPIEKENPANLTDFPSFTIYFNTKDKNYYIKDFNVGIGALMKIKEYKIDHNILINIGANYLVICIELDNIVVKIFNNSILQNNNNNMEQKFETRSFNIKKRKIV